MKLTRLIALVLTVLMIASLSTVCLTANAAEVETAGIGSKYGTYFNADYLENKAYNGTDLGSTYTPSKTTWKVWSPEAKSVKLNLYKTGSDLEIGAENLGTHTLKKDNATGVWSLTLDGDFKNIYYTYTVDTAKLGAMETYDIYAKACGVNGNRSMVVDLDSTDPEGWENDQHVFQDQVTDKDIWEVHIADLTSSDNSGVSPEYQGKFLGFVEGGLKYNGKSVGVDYLVEQGIKVVHIQCPFDFASGDERDDSSYNWGYDPKNYNVPEGLYSTNPYDGNVRITEFKQMVQALHDRGISVVMGVVYNHYSGSDKSPFNYTVPGYYFRMESATQYNNASNCGNALASDKAMFRNYMKQSLKYWVEEYHVDGFRFDLMAIHDTDTMKQIRQMFDGMYNGEGKKIIMYGEPWLGFGAYNVFNSFYECTASKISTLDANIAIFNETTREAIKGYFAGDTTKKSAVKIALESKNTLDISPNKTINYYDCHDGLTWWDTLTGTGKYDSTDATLRSKHRTSMTYLFTSRGIPFMLAGTEFARTKYGNENSYNAGDVNAFDWKRIETYATEVAYVKGLREIRNAFSPFRSQTAITPQYITTGNNIIAYSLNNTKSGEWSKAVVIVNVGGAASVTLPAGEWTVVANGTKAGLTSLGTASGSYNVSANGSAILVQGETTAKSATYETVTVKHVADGKTIKTTESLYAVGDTWRAAPDNYTVFNHNVVSIEANAGTKLGNTYYGTVEAGKDVVVTINYEKFIDDGYLTIKYVDEKGKDIANDIEFRMYDGNRYNLPFSNVSGYELVSSKYPANYKGTFDADNPATITFVYKPVANTDITVYYYYSNKAEWGNKLGMYCYTDGGEEPLGAWSNSKESQNIKGMTPVTSLSELPEGEKSTANWYKKTVKGYTSLNVMFYNFDNKQEPLNNEPGYVASGTVYIKNKVLRFSTDVIVSHIDAETGKKLAEDERTSYSNVLSNGTYETKAKEGLGEVIVPTNAKGNYTAGSICVVYLYGAKQEEPTTVVTEPITTAPTEPASSEVPTATATAPTEPASSEVPTEPVSSEVTTAPTEPKTEVTTTAPIQTTAPEPEYIDPLYLGDSDLSGVVNIKDATLVQKHAAFLLMLLGDGLTCADANGDTNVNVKDATVIQKYLAKMETPYAVGELIPGTGVWTTVPVATTPAATEPPVTAEPGTTVLGTIATTATAPTTEPTTAEPTVTTEPTEITTVEPTETDPTEVEPTTEEPVITDPPEDTEPTEIVTDPPEDTEPTDPPYIDDPVYDTYSVCFSNNKRWAGTVYAYTWDSVGGINAEWPGVPMTYYDSNEYGEDRYVYDVPAGHNFIIFTDGTSKSVDVDLTTYTDFGFYLLDTQVADGGYDVGNYPFI